MRFLFLGRRETAATPPESQFSFLNQDPAYKITLRPGFEHNDRCENHGVTVKLFCNSPDASIPISVSKPLIDALQCRGWQVENHLNEYDQFIESGKLNKLWLPEASYDEVYAFMLEWHKQRNESRGPVACDEEQLRQIFSETFGAREKPLSTAAQLTIKQTIQTIGKSLAEQHQNTRVFVNSDINMLRYPPVSATHAELAQLRERIEPMLPAASVARGA